MSLAHLLLRALKIAKKIMAKFKTTSIGIL